MSSSESFFFLSSCYLSLVQLVILKYSACRTFRYERLTTLLCHNDSNLPTTILSVLNIHIHLARNEINSLDGRNIHRQTAK